MTCYSPITAWLDDNNNVSFVETKKYNKKIQIPCRKCSGCIKKQISDWNVRLSNESKYHKEVCFVTLTFDDKLINNKTLIEKYGANPFMNTDIKYSKEYFKKFMKRLRRALEPKKITYYHIGEYGDKNGRPHHHLLIFGTDFHEDRCIMQKSKTNHEQYTSETLYNAWKLGRISIEDVVPENIGYIVGYNTNKIKKVINGKKPYMTYSNRGKIGIKYAEQFKSEILEKKNIPVNKDFRLGIPRAYIEFYKKYYETDPQFIKYRISTEEYIIENTITDKDRLRSLEKIQRAKLTRKVR